MPEIELKFQVPAASLPALRRAIERGRTRVLRLRAHYFDTADELLARHALALRLRHEGGRWVQTLKAAGAHAVGRLEHEVDLGPGAAARPPALDLSRHDGSDAGRAMREALRSCRGEPVFEARYSIDVRRLARIVAVAGGKVELALDEGRVRAGARERRLCEFEIELKSGGTAALFASALQWSQRHGLWLDLVPKSERGRLLVGAALHRDAAVAGHVAMQAGIDAGHLMRRAIGSCVEQIALNAGEIAAGSDSEEHVHQMRVGIRRLRTVVRELAELMPPLDAGWQAPLAEAFRALGAHRDAALFEGSLGAELRAAGAPAVHWPAAETTLVARRGIARAPALQRALLELLAFSVDEPASTSPVDVKVFVAQRLKKLHRAIVRDGARFGELAAAEQHRVRKRLKRLRYLAEMTADLFDRAAVERYIDRTKAAQDALGLHHDRAIALERFGAVTDAQPTAWFAVGWLGAQQQRLARACRDAIGKLADAPRIWKRRRAAARLSRPRRATSPSSDRSS